MTADMYTKLERLLGAPTYDVSAQRKMLKHDAPAVQRCFDDIVMQADSGRAVLEAFAALPPGCDPARELTRAIDARYKRLETEMGFATSGMRRMVCLGALCMSAIGLTLAVSGLHLGALSFACGASVLALFIAMAVLTYCWKYLRSRHTHQGRVELQQHCEVLVALRRLCDQHHIMPDKPCRVVLDRCKAVINGRVGFVALEVMRGTILEPMVAAASLLQRKYKTWRLRRAGAKN